ncbi:MAG: hypothetical protein QNJ07_16675 [Woeseiaceae bacterium]|nr:hypothetical protein [Woeseiaceae bacterium]
MVELSMYPSGSVSDARQRWRVKGTQQRFRRLEVRALPVWLVAGTCLQLCHPIGRVGNNTVRTTDL